MHQKKPSIDSKFLDLLQTSTNLKNLSQNIIQLSDEYMQFGKDLSKIWQSENHTGAYLNYFLPLNLMRSTAVLQECLSIKFCENLQRAFDFGSGPGTIDLSLENLALKFEELHFIEKSANAIQLHQTLLQKLNVSPRNRSWSHLLPDDLSTSDLIIFSYSLSELADLPPQALKAEALLFIEPSTQKAARRLQQLRGTLIKKGYYAWAPCTHQDFCPLLQHSKTDWCHQRIHIEQNDFMKKLEVFLPIKNQSLTYSYLCMRKTPPQATAHVRVIGDTLYERGKTKQAICRSSDREFFSWLTRHGEPERIERGTRMPLPASFEVKGDELRITLKD